MGSGGPARVWDVISRPLEWPAWWMGVTAVDELEPGLSDGLGALHRYTWKSALPYRLAFDMRVTKVERPWWLEGDASGELEGRGVWTLVPSDAGTTVRYEWDIRTTRRWMNVLSPLLRPAFAWNHDYVMRSGSRGLAELLGVPVIDLGERRDSRKGSALIAVAGVGATVAAVVALCRWSRRALARG